MVDIGFTGFLQIMSIAFWGAFMVAAGWHVGRLVAARFFGPVHTSSTTSIPTPLEVSVRMKP